MKTLEQQFDDLGRMEILNGVRCFYSKTNDCNFVPRMDILMVDLVDIECLQSALELTMDRFRVFRLTVTQDEEKYYLKENNIKPVVHKFDKERHEIGAENNNGYLIWIGVSGAHIYIDPFQGITDGRGIQPFVKCLLVNYCAARYGNRTLKEIGTLLLEKQNDDKECLDSLYFVDENESFGKKQQRSKEVFHFSDKQITSGHRCFIYTMCVNADEFDSYMRSNKSSRTAVFATFLNKVIADCNEIGDRSIVASIAADVRKIYKVENTMRECTGVIPLQYDSESHKATAQQQFQEARAMIISGMLPEFQLSAAVEMKRANIQLERRIKSIEGKKQFANRIHPYAYNEYTYAMSNVGKITFGQEADKYVSSVRAFTCANTYPVIVEIMQFKDTYNISYCTRIENDPYIHKFAKLLVDAGITCSYKQEEDYVEPLVVL